MTLLKLLAHRIRTNGPILTARMSSAQSSTKYSYWGAARYQVRLGSDGKPTNAALERASSDRRSERLADQDTDDLCDSEGRIRLQRIGKLTEKDAAIVLSDEMPEIQSKQTQRAKLRLITITSLSDRLIAFKNARRLKAFANDGYKISHVVHSRWDRNGQFNFSATHPLLPGVSYSTNGIPTLAEVEKGLRDLFTAKMTREHEREVVELKRKAEEAAKYEAETAKIMGINTHFIFNGEGGFSPKNN